MAFVGMVVNDCEFVTEASTDNVVVPTVILPDQTVVDSVWFGLDNFILDEIENFTHRGQLPGRPEDYQMRLTNGHGISKLLDNKQVVEFYMEDLMSDCTVHVEPAGTQQEPGQSTDVKSHDNKRAV